MKKFVILGVLALALVAITQQQADAWCNIKFGAGVNLNWQGGDNSLLWGLYRSGQVPHAGPGVVPPFHGHQPFYGANPTGFPFADQGSAFAPQSYHQMMPPAPLSPQVNQQATFLQPVGYYYPSYQTPVMPYYYSGYPAYWYGY